MNNDTPVRMHYPALDGLRGIAILLVVLYHNFSFIPFLNYGWLGVDLFFVLSGFLITEILLSKRNARNYFKNFYTRRMLRIFPLYYLCLILFILILPTLKNFPFNFNFYTGNQLWFWFYIENWLLILKPWGDSTLVLNHFWSLAVEEQFYLIWPIVVVFIRKPKHLLWLCTSLLIIVVLSRCYIWFNRNIYPAYSSIFLFTRIDGILIGAILAIVKLINYNFLKKYSYLVISGLALLNFIFYFINKNEQFTFPYWAIVGYTTFAIMFALLAGEVLDSQNKILNLILNIPVLKFLGKISYGFYVFHWPVYLLLYGYVETWIRTIVNFTHVELQISVSFILTIVAFIISLISYYTYEKFWRQLKERFV
jgi:peptidoglycan/LPS O-acetylase OafA/YrhL